MISTTLFVGFFVFSSTASSWIFNISASLMVAKREFTPQRATTVWLVSVRSNLFSAQESNAPINSKLQHPLPPGIWTFEDWIVQIPAPSGQTNVQMPDPIVGFVYQMPPPPKKNRRRLLSSVIKLGYKHANTCLVTLYMMMPFTKTTLILKLWRIHYKLNKLPSRTMSIRSVSSSSSETWQRLFKWNIPYCFHSIVWQRRITQPNSFDSSIAKRKKKTVTQPNVVSLPLTLSSRPNTC